MGIVRMEEEQFPEALEHFEKELELSTVRRDVEHIGYAALQSGAALWPLGRYKEAQTRLDQAETAAAKFADLRLASRPAAGGYSSQRRQVSGSGRNVQPPTHAHQPGRHGHAGGAEPRVGLGPDPLGSQTGRAPAMRTFVRDGSGGAGRKRASCGHPGGRRGASGNRRLERGTSRHSACGGTISQAAGLELASKSPGGACERGASGSRWS